MMRVVTSSGVAYHYDPRAGKPKSLRRSRALLCLSGVEREQEMDRWMWLIHKNLGASMAEISFITGKSIRTVERRFAAMRRFAEEHELGS